MSVYSIFRFHLQFFSVLYKEVEVYLSYQEHLYTVLFDWYYQQDFLQDIVGQSLKKYMHNLLAELI